MRHSGGEREDTHTHTHSTAHLEPDEGSHNGEGDGQEEVQFGEDGVSGLPKCPHRQHRHLPPPRGGPLPLMGTRREGGKEGGKEGRREGGREGGREGEGRMSYYICILSQHCSFNLRL